MYTKEYNRKSGRWDILDPDGDRMAIADDEGSADVLLSHLNRG